MNVVAIVQTRMGSTRLPGKVLKPVLSKPLLEYQVERLRRTECLDQIVIATTTQAEDQTIVDFSKELSIPYYRGSEEDVLSRYVEAANHYDADVIVRITSDCPIIDPQVIDQVVSYYLENHHDYDYVSNTLQRTYPRGMDTEVFSKNLLEKVSKLAETQSEREHVTAYILKRSDQYKVKNIAHSENHSDNRWTVDTVEDFQLIKKIIEHLYPKDPHFTLEDTLKLLKEYPEWKKINAHVEQKKI
ncbi:glycosyltransferase family protein [Alkalibacillus haloalkaliphilus]|uniref:glycosyltransferase family protein n=1 Tax=Alkalibacillus haloalkaliphilus TaxID=94136 RepID=UPI002935BE37|nr:glycosyltransferase family protein [Alkalibacillus haloalkaliphilus]MDV2583345.1 glycosyltransferase family protein [Alkalibacillus haloalkaliphilus]